MTKQTNHFDVIIAGGGLSGCLTALALSKLTLPQASKLNIAIIEANEVLSNTALTFDSRVLALSHGSVDYLKNLQVWQGIATKAAPIETIHISDKGFYGKARVYAKDHGVDALGHVIEMSVLGDALVEQVKQQNNVTWFTPDTISTIDWHKDHVNVTLASAQTISANLLVACDGGQSKCRELANIASDSKDYQQTAVIANLSMQTPHQNIAYERFTQHGPFAMLPLPENKTSSTKCSMVWTLPPDKAAEVMALSDDAFKQAITQSFGSWLGKVDIVGQRAAYPLILLRAKEQIFHRTVLVGNASHTIHPIAGQGFNLGLRDVKVLVEQIARQIKAQQDYGTLASLMAYSEQRAKDHNTVIGITDSLVTLFSNTLPPLVIGRNIGLKVMNYCPSLKNAFVNKTMGY
ncbi:2-octaprenyl-6-methoxyphenyl hydroxylase [Thalassotalea marina]|uniref:2-octaprenyl-6-methoxyphenyl hydroxylase n=1 Tax=Thalassotalea marina TaxID=1673741 RepID=A0A919EKI5_9GAMM|nr:2-octaprenyl-6-methoxyphenyl hydroxylase [Thalassotalea marina]GHF95070.1 2-octaprenyl-6-methoxyphenyl hydroxylase [Thalassotalea marina]